MLETVQPMTKKSLVVALRICIGCRGLDTGIHSLLIVWIGVEIKRMAGRCEFPFSESVFCLTKPHCLISGGLCFEAIDGGQCGEICVGGRAEGISNDGALLCGVSVYWCLPLGWASVRVHGTWTLGVEDHCSCQVCRRLCPSVCD